MKKVFLSLLAATITMFSLASFSSAIILQVPPAQGQEDIIQTGPSQIQTDESTLFEIIQIINKYLWFSIWGVAMVVFVIAGFYLITASGNADQTKKANKMFFGSIIAIMICIVSYSVVRILVNLF